MCDIEFYNSLCINIWINILRRNKNIKKNEEIY